MHTTLKSSCLVTLLSTFLCVQALSQELSIGLYGGAMTYQGDLVEGLVDLSEIQPAFGVSVRYLWFKDIAITGNFITGKVTGDDANSKSFPDRGFSFESNLSEASLVVEYHPIGRGRWNRTNELIKDLSPYVYGGVGYAFGEAEVIGLPPNSQDLLDVTSSRLVVPMGIGVQYTFSESLYVELVGGTRYVTDDYIDGVSVAGNPDAKDWYLTAGIKIGYYLSGEPSMF